MDRFSRLSGVAAPLPLINVDTDMIIPKQFLKTTKRTGLGSALFFEQRYNDDALLRAWLSRAYFGVQPLGVEPAAQALFQKSASALNETESLYLAVLLRSPRLQRDPERWAQRVRIVAAQLPRETIGAR